MERLEERRLLSDVYAIQLESGMGKKGSSGAPHTGSLRVDSRYDTDGDGWALVEAQSPKSAVELAIKGVVSVDTTPKGVRDWIRKRSGDKSFAGRIDRYDFAENTNAAFRVADDGKKIMLEDVASFAPGVNDADYNDRYWNVRIKKIVPDLVIQNLSEEGGKAKNHELAPGAQIAVNHDDDDRNGVADLSQQGGVQGEDELMPLQIKLPVEVKAGQVTLKLSATGKLKIWEYAEKSGSPVVDETASEITWTVGDQPSKLWIEGFSGDSLSATLIYTPEGFEEEGSTDVVNITVSDVKPILIGFYGADVPWLFPNPGNQEMMRIGNELQAEGYDQRTFTSRTEGPHVAFGWMFKKLDTNGDGKYDPMKGDMKREVRIYGHSWGGVSAVFLSRKIAQHSRMNDNKVDLVAVIDPVTHNYTDSTYGGGVMSNVRQFWNRYQTGNSDVKVAIGNLVFHTPQGSPVPSQSHFGTQDQIDMNKTDHGYTIPNPFTHFSIISEVRNELLTLLKQ